MNQITKQMQKDWVTLTDKPGRPIVRGTGTIHTIGSADEYWHTDWSAPDAGEAPAPTQLLRLSDGALRSWGLSLCESAVIPAKVTSISISFLWPLYR